MPTVVEMPRLSDTMREGTVASWSVKVGDRVAAGDELAEIETDKAVMAFESFDEGVLLALLVEVGDTVPLGTPIAVLGDEGEDVEALVADLKQRVAEAMAGLEAGEGGGAEAEAEEAAQAEAEEPAEAEAEGPAEAEAEEAPKAKADAAPKAKAEGAAKPQAEAAEPEAAGPPGSLAGPAPVDADGLRVKASPLARRLARERGIDLTRVEGSGPRGRVVLRDVEDREPTRRITPGGTVTASALEDTTVRVTQMRKTIARRLVESKQGAPHFYLTITVDAAPMAALREELNAAQDVQRISFNDLVMRACVVALLRHPEVNAGWEGKVIRRFGGVHLGFAVALDEGLITPVVRSAERLPLLALASRIRDLAGRAREGTLEPSDYEGNSFCVSNLGMAGIEAFTAVINPPAACILAVGAVRDEPVVRGGAVVPGKVMTVTLSCDHRVVDGAMGAAFLADLKHALERPLALVL